MLQDCYEQFAFKLISFLILYIRYCLCVCVCVMYVQILLDFSYFIDRVNYQIIFAM